MGTAKSEKKFVAVRRLSDDRTCGGRSEFLSLLARARCARPRSIVAERVPSQGLAPAILIGSSVRRTTSLLAQTRLNESLEQRIGFVGLL